MVVRFDKRHLSPKESRRVGRYLKEARRSAGVSKASVAHRLNIPETTLGAYEAGRARFPVRLIFAAARAIGVTPYHLVAGCSDRVINPWGPSLMEWSRTRRSEYRSGEEKEAPEGREEELVLEDDQEEPRASKEGEGEPMELLQGDEARRALEFLDKEGPSARMEGGEDDLW